MTAIERYGEPGDCDVVVAFPLGREAMAVLTARLGPGFEVRDIRQAGTDVDVVLCPPVSPQAIRHLKAEFPDATIVALELDDLLAEVRGPVQRVLDAGADAYYVAPSLDSLGAYLRELAPRRARRGLVARSVTAESPEVAALPADLGDAVPDAGTTVVDPVARTDR